MVNATLAAEPPLTHSTMSTNDPNGKYVCIHSVVIDQGLRRRGLATQMLKSYIVAVREKKPELKGFLLICKEKLISFYEACGFTLIGKSSVVHGQEQWYECRLIL